MVGRFEFPIFCRRLSEALTEYVFAFNKTFIDHAAPVKSSGKVSLLKIFIQCLLLSLKNKLQFDLLFSFTQLMNSETPKYYRSLYSYYILESAYSAIPVFHVEFYSFN